MNAPNLHTVAQLELWLGTDIPPVVTPNDVHALLEKRGYDLKRTLFNEDMAEYMHPDNSVAVIWVPLIVHYGDYRKRLLEALEDIRRFDILLKSNA